MDFKHPQQDPAVGYVEHCNEAPSSRRRVAIHRPEYLAESSEFCDRLYVKLNIVTTEICQVMLLVGFVGVKTSQSESSVYERHKWIVFHSTSLCTATCSLHSSSPPQ
jgi:hypothetical protein